MAPVSNVSQDGGDTIGILGDLLERHADTRAVTSDAAATAARSTGSIITCETRMGGTCGWLPLSCSRM